MNQTGSMAPSLVGGSEVTRSSCPTRSGDTSTVEAMDTEALAANTFVESHSKNGVHHVPSSVNRKISVNNNSCSVLSSGDSKANIRTEVMDNRTCSTSDSGVNENCVSDLNLTKDSSTNSGGDMREKLNGGDEGNGDSLPGKDCMEDTLVDDQEEETGPDLQPLSREQLLALSPDEMWERWQLHERRQEKLQAKLMQRTCSTSQDGDEGELREVNERLKSQLAEAQRKEAYHVMRLTAKEHELQEMAASVAASKCFNVGRCSLLDPAVNLCIERLKRDLEAARSKMEEAQNELAAWKFTPDSNTGKQLMAKCRLLIKENEELGRVISSGKLAKLEGDIALQRNFTEELKKSQSELDEFLLEMDEDTEGMQGTILYLQHQLRTTKQQLQQQQQQQHQSMTAAGVSVTGGCSSPAPALQAATPPLLQPLPIISGGSATQRPPSPPPAAAYTATTECTAEDAVHLPASNTEESVDPSSCSAVGDESQEEQHPSSPIRTLEANNGGTIAGGDDPSSAGCDDLSAETPVEEEVIIPCEGASLTAAVGPSSHCPVQLQVEDLVLKNSRDTDSASVLARVESMIVPHDKLATDGSEHRRAPAAADSVQPNLTNGKKRTHSISVSDGDQAMEAAGSVDDGAPVTEPMCKRTKVTMLGEGEEDEEGQGNQGHLENGVLQ